MFIIYRIKINGVHRLVMVMGVKPDMDFNNFDDSNSHNRSIGGKV